MVGRGQSQRLRGPGFCRNPADKGTLSYPYLHTGAGAEAAPTDGDICRDGDVDYKDLAIFADNRPAGLQQPYCEPNLKQRDRENELPLARVPIPSTLALCAVAAVKVKRKRG